MSTYSPPTETPFGQSAALGGTGEPIRQNNLQRIAQKKSQVRSWSHSKKLEKLAIYFSCRADDGCNCNGWKNPNPPPTTPPRLDVPQPLANLTNPCRSCGHILGAHVSHLENVPEEELNRLLGIVVDVENLFMCVHKEEDTDSKQVYFYLFKLLRKSIMQMTTPSVDGPLGNPPFEKPNIVKGVSNFVMYKFGHLSKNEWQTMYELAKMFLHCLNHWKLETPSAWKQHSPPEAVSAYKVNYTRWLCYCHAPAFCDSLPHYEMTRIFGKTLFRSVFQTVRQQLLDKIRADKDKMPPEKHNLILSHFPRFLSMLEEEVYDANSPVWDPDFRQTPSNLPPSMPAEEGSSSSSMVLSRGFEKLTVASAQAGSEEGFTNLSMNTSLLNS